MTEDNFFWREVGAIFRFEGSELVGIFLEALRILLLDEANPVLPDEDEGP